MSLSIDLDEDMRARVQRLADARRQSILWVMDEAIRDYVEREERREAFKRDAQNAWERFQTDGLHLTLDEADAWLSQLESGVDVELPKCHV